MPRLPLAAALALLSSSVLANPPRHPDIETTACEGPGLVVRHRDHAKKKPTPSRKKFAKDADEGGDLSDNLDPVEESGSGDAGLMTFLFGRSGDADQDKTSCRQRFRAMRERYGDDLQAVPSTEPPPTTVAQAENLLRNAPTLSELSRHGFSRLSHIFDRTKDHPELTSFTEALERLGANANNNNSSVVVAPRSGARRVDGGGDNNNNDPGGGPRGVVTTASPQSYATLRTEPAPQPQPGWTPPAVVDRTPGRVGAGIQRVGAWLGDTTGWIVDKGRRAVGWVVEKWERARGAEGHPSAGRLQNGVPLPWKGEGFVFVRYGRWGTPEMVAGIQAVAKDMKAAGAPPLQIGDISYQYGGPIRRHKSHQNGRDVDIFFVGSGGRFDVPMNFRLLAAALAQMNVTNVFIDTPLKNALLSYGHQLLREQKISEEVYQKAAGVMSYEPGHGDHFHVRIAG